MSSLVSLQAIERSDKNRTRLAAHVLSSVSEHDTLVTSTVRFEVSVVETLCDVGRLLLDGNEDIAGCSKGACQCMKDQHWHTGPTLVVKTLVGVIVADLLNGSTDDRLEVDGGLGGDFTENHDL